MRRWRNYTFLNRHRAHRPYSGTRRFCVVWFSTSHCLAVETDVGETGGSQSCGGWLSLTTEWWTFQLCNRQHDSPVKRGCWDAHLLRERIPPSCLLEVHLYGYWLYHASLHVYVTARPATKAPVTTLLLTGSLLHGGHQPRTYRNLCCTWYVGYVPARHSTDGDVALLTEQACGGVRQV